MQFFLKEIQNLFPDNNFDFLQNNLLTCVLNIVRGRFVGGVVRDALLGIITNDIDIASPLLPQEIFNLLTQNNFFPVATGIEYGTISIFFKEFKIEITSLRKDVKNYGRKAEVIFGGTWEEDSNRRDFTFNALFLEIKNNIVILHDYHNGLQDLKNSQINFIGNYKQRIQEDYLRVLRFIRFLLRYGPISYEKHIYKLFEFVSYMKILSIERVLMEINAILKCDKWILGIQIINELQISLLFFGKYLYIKNQLNSIIITEKEKLLIIFHNIPIEKIKKLPLQKYDQTFLNKYITSDFSILSLAKIWQKTKNLSLLINMLHIKYIIDQQVILDIENLSEQNFILYKQNYIFQYIDGPCRGEEELQIKINFLSSFIKPIL
jgi:tRNA nucleotidyltransferase/poly(A) polymerase